MMNLELVRRRQIKLIYRRRFYLRVKVQRKYGILVLWVPRGRFASWYTILNRVDNSHKIRDTIQWVML